jgi:hypothetical protein
MKKVIFLFSFAALIAVGFISCSSKSTAEKGTEKSVAVVYTCTMHPEVQSDKPGKCPKCGMDLVVKK